MVLIESLPVTVAPRPAAVDDVCRSVVWLRGEHDIATTADLSETLARTIAADDADVVVDLSEVTFMGAETVGVLVRARLFLWSRSRALQLRAPSAGAMRTLGLCDLTVLLEPPPAVPRRTNGTAPPGTRLAAPVTDRVERRPACATIARIHHPGPHRRTHIVLPKQGSSKVGAPPKQVALLRGL